MRKFSAHISCRCAKRYKMLMAEVYLAFNIFCLCPCSRSKDESHLNVNGRAWIAHDCHTGDLIWFVPISFVCLFAHISSKSTTAFSNVHKSSPYLWNAGWRLDDKQQSTPCLHTLTHINMMLLLFCYCEHTICVFHRANELKYVLFGYRPARSKYSSLNTSIHQTS